MNRIPVVTLRRTDGGWSLLCSTCESSGFAFTRPEADLMAVNHQKTCAKNGAPRWP